MSKVVLNYLKLKKQDKDKLYLFKVGNFYIFIGDDAEYINNYMVLKKTKFSNDYIKYGFPINKIDDYKKVFNNLKLNVEIIDNINEINVIDELKKINLDDLSKKEAINYLKEVKNVYE